MKLFASNENRVKCGKCGTEFDLVKNDGCPLCGFGKKVASSEISKPKPAATSVSINYLGLPSKEPKMIKGALNITSESKAVGSWGMFNSFFPGKAILRILSNHLSKDNKETERMDTILELASQVFSSYGLSKLRGFPKDTTNENSISRLVYHFIKTFNDMGLIVATRKDGSTKNVWEQKWTNISLGISKKGYEFLQLHNSVFDESEQNQVLSESEQKWLIQYLKEIDKEGYKEYSMLLQIQTFLQEGNNGKDELWDWFKTNDTFINYVKEWSRKSHDDKEFKKQINNLSPTFASGKLALLRELGVVRNKRNDYTVIGDLE